MTPQTKQQPPSLVTHSSLTTLFDHIVFADESLSIEQLTIAFSPFLDQVLPSHGFILLDPQGCLIQSSPKAQELCSVLRHIAHEGSYNPALKHQGIALPAAIRQLVECLMESRQLFPDEQIQLLEAKGLLEGGTRVRMQAEWIRLSFQHSPYIVVTLEDLKEVAHQQALLDGHRYQFTPRERSVWELYLQELSYTQIAEELFISLNTVKRHMKSIHSKRKHDRD